MFPNANQSFQRSQEDELSARDLRSKGRLVFAVFRVVVIWGIVAYLYLSLILFSTVPRLLVGYSDLTILLQAVVEKLSLFSPLLLLFIPLSVLAYFVAISKSIAKFVLFSVGTLSVLVSLGTFPIFHRSCADLCLGQGLGLFAEIVMLFTAITILPMAWAKRLIDHVDTRMLLHKTLLPGLVVLLLSSLLVGVIIYPSLIKELRKTKQTIEELQAAEQEERNLVIQLKSYYRILKPTYLPMRLQRSTGTESVSNRGYQLLYECNPGLFRIQQIPLGKQKEVEDPKYRYQKERVDIANNSGIVYEKYYLGPTDPYRTNPDPLERWLVWYTSDLQIIIGESYPCLLSKQELIDIAESMRPAVD